MLSSPAVNPWQDHESPSDLSCTIRRDWSESWNLQKWRTGDTESHLPISVHTTLRNCLWLTDRTTPAEWGLVANMKRTNQARRTVFPTPLADLKLKSTGSTGVSPSNLLSPYLLAEILQELTLPGPGASHPAQPSAFLSPCKSFANELGRIVVAFLDPLVHVGKMLFIHRSLPLPPSCTWHRRQSSCTP